MDYLEHLKSLKEKRHLTSAEIAELSGIPATTIQRILSGTTPNPTFETISRITIAMGGSLDEMAGLKQSDAPPVASHIEKTLDSYAILLKEKDERIRDLKEEHEKSRKEKRQLGIALACVIAFVLIILSVDILNGHFGYFRY